MDMEYKYNDGGRSRYMKSVTGRDCVVRSVAIATGADYIEVHKVVKEMTNERPSLGIHKKHVRKILERFGGVWTPKMKIGSGCTTHLREGEIPPKGRFVCSCSGHLTAVIDNVIMDIEDPSRGGTRCVYGYWEFKQRV